MDSPSPKIENYKETLLKYAEKVGHPYDQLILSYIGDIETESEENSIPLRWDGFNSFEELLEDVQLYFDFNL